MLSLMTTNYDLLFTLAMTHDYHMYVYMHVHMLAYFIFETAVYYIVQLLFPNANITTSLIVLYNDVHVWPIYLEMSRNSIGYYIMNR